MTVFGHPVLFDCLKNMEDTASEKTPMQWHTTRTLSLDDALVERTYRQFSKALELKADREPTGYAARLA